MVVEPSLEVPSDLLANAFRIFALDNRPIGYREMSRKYLSAWRGIYPDGPPLETPPWLAPHKEARKVIEAQMLTTEKISRINQIHFNFGPTYELLKPYSSLPGTNDTRLTAGEQWLAWMLFCDGLPRANEFVAAGLRDPSEILIADRNELKRRWHYSKKILDRFDAYQEKVRTGDYWKP